MIQVCNAIIRRERGLSVVRLTITCVRLSELITTFSFFFGKNLHYTAYFISFHYNHSIIYIHTYIYRLTIPNAATPARVPFTKVRLRLWTLENRGRPSGCASTIAFRESMPLPSRDSLIGTLKKIWKIEACDGDANQWGVWQSNVCV